MKKTKLFAGTVATLVALIVVIGLAIFLAVVMEIDAKKNWFTITAAFTTISVWIGIYKWLRPTEPVKTKITKDSTAAEIAEHIANLISNEDFKNIYIRNAKSVLRMGFFFSLTCLPAVIAVLVFSKDLTVPLAIIGLVLLLLFGIVGLILISKSRKTISLVNNGNDPLILALENNNSEYVKWYYKFEIPTTTGAIKEMKKHQIFIFTEASKKGTSMTLKSTLEFDSVMDYLAYKFPDAPSKHTSKLKAEMKEVYGFKS